MLTFFLLPEPHELANGELGPMVTGALLLMDGGQATVSMSHLKELSKEYLGYFVQFDPVAEKFTLRLVSRPDKKEEEYVPTRG